MTPPISTSTISIDCTEQESIPDASTPINQKPTPKQDELNVAIGVEKDKGYFFLLILMKAKLFLSKPFFNVFPIFLFSLFHIFLFSYIFKCCFFYIS